MQIITSNTTSQRDIKLELESNFLTAASKANKCGSSSPGAMVFIATANLYRYSYKSMMFQFYYTKRNST